MNCCFNVSQRSVDSSTSHVIVSRTGIDLKATCKVMLFDERSQASNTLVVEASVKVVRSNK